MGSRTHRGRGKVCGELAGCHRTCCVLQISGKSLRVSYLDISGANPATYILSVCIDDMSGPQQKALGRGKRARTETWKIKDSAYSQDEALRTQNFQRASVRRRVGSEKLAAEQGRRNIEYRRRPHLLEERRRAMVMRGKIRKRAILRW